MTNDTPQQQSFGMRSKDEHVDSNMHTPGAQDTFAQYGSGQGSQQASSQGQAMPQGQGQVSPQVQMMSQTQGQMPSRAQVPLQMQVSPQGQAQAQQQFQSAHPNAQKPYANVPDAGAQAGAQVSAPQGKPPKKRSASFYVAIVIALIAIIAAAVIGYMWWQDSQASSSRDTNALIGQVEGKSDEEIQAELNRIVEEGMLNISIASEVVFENGESEGALKIENSPSNHYLMQVDITRDDTGDVIYESGVLEPNYHIQTAKLDAPLSAGTYVCTATFNALDPETEEQIGSAAAKISVVVLN